MLLSLTINGDDPKCKNKSTSSGAVMSRRKFNVELDLSESWMLESNDTTRAQGLKSLVSSHCSSQLRTAVGRFRSVCIERNTMSARLACCRAESANPASCNIPNRHQLIWKPVSVPSQVSRFLNTVLARHPVGKSSCNTRTSGPAYSVSSQPDDVPDSRMGF